MSQQRQAIPRVIQRVANCGVEAGLILGGSVHYGYERPESDLDFFAIGEQGLDEALREYSLMAEKNGCKVLETRKGPFPIRVAYWSTESLNTVLETIPYMMYPVLDGEIVYDPVNLAEQYHQEMRRYFDSHPRLEQAWVEQLNQVRRFKIGEISSLEFPEWSDFLRYIEKTGLNE